MSAYRLLPDIEQRDAGAVGIFAFADRFHDVLRALSPSYVERAWNTLAALDMERDGLRLGYTHPSYTTFAGAGDVDDEPHACFGFVHQDAWAATRLDRFDDVLAAARPPLRCGAADVRAQAFDAAPDDFAIVVRIFRAFAVDEITDWIAAADRPHRDEPWRAVARVARPRRRGRGARGGGGHIQSRRLPHHRRRRRAPRCVGRPARLIGAHSAVLRSQRMSSNTCEVVVGRLLEIRLGPGYLTPGDVDAMIAMIRAGLGKIAEPEQVIIAADWRTQRIMNPPTAERAKAMLTGANPRILRSAILTFPENALTNLQVVRLVREAENPSRRHFTDVAVMRAWLDESLRDDERARLAEFLAR